MANSVKPIVCCGLDMDFWPVVEPAIAKALELDGGRTNTDEIKELIEGHYMQMWAVHDGSILAVMTTEVVQYPLRKSLKVVTLTGDFMSDWLDVVLTTLEAYGKEKGCDMLELLGRKGWEKTLKPFGWETKRVVMTRSI